MKLHHFVGASALAIGLATPLAVLAEPQSFILTQEHFSVLDVDNDGKVSETEYRNFMLQAFGKLDKNGDGVLTQDEVGEILTADQFYTLDKNGNSTVTKDEFMEQVMADFKRYDYDSDGHLLP